MIYGYKGGFGIFFFLLAIKIWRKSKTHSCYCHIYNKSSFHFYRHGTNFIWNEILKWFSFVSLHISFEYLKRCEVKRIKHKNCATCVADKAAAAATIFLIKIVFSFRFSLSGWLYCWDRWYIGHIKGSSLRFSGRMYLSCWIAPKLPMCMFCSHLDETVDRCLGNNNQKNKSNIRGYCYIIKVILILISNNNTAKRSHDWNRNHIVEIHSI